MPSLSEYKSMVHSRREAARSYPKSAAAKGKIRKTMHEFKEGTLHSGSKHGPIVTSRKQAVAISLSQARREG